MINSGNQSQRGAVSHSKVIDVLCVVILVAYFLYFALPAIGGSVQRRRPRGSVFLLVFRNVKKVALGEYLLLEGDWSPGWRHILSAAFSFFLG